MQFEDSMREAMHDYVSMAPRPTVAGLVAGARRRRMRTRATVAGSALAVTAIGAASYGTFGPGSGTAGRPIAPIGSAPAPTGSAGPATHDHASPSGTGKPAPYVTLPSPVDGFKSSPPAGEESPVKSVSPGDAIVAPGDVAGAFYWMTTDSVCHYTPPEASTPGNVACDSPLTVVDGHSSFCTASVSAPPPRTGDGVLCAGHPSPVSAFENSGSYDSDLHAQPAGVYAGPDLPVRIEVRAIEALIGPAAPPGGLVTHAVSLATRYTVPGMKPGWAFWLPSVVPSHPDPDPGPADPTDGGTPTGPRRTVVSNAYDDVWLIDAGGRRIAFTADPPVTGLPGAGVCVMTSAGMCSSVP